MSALAGQPVSEKARTLLWPRGPLPRAMLKPLVCPSISTQPIDHDLASKRDLVALQQGERVRLVFVGFGDV